MQLPKKRANKLSLPLLLIFLVSLIILVKFFRSIDLGLDFNRDSLQSPVIIPSENDTLKKMLSAADLTPDSTTEIDNTIQASYSGDLTVYFSKVNDLKLQVDSLHFIFSRAKIEGRQPKIVDLRFDRPVVSY